MSRDMLRSLIDNIDDTEIETVYNILIRFISSDTPLPDEEEAIISTEGEYESGSYVSLDEAFA